MEKRRVHDGLRRGRLKRAGARALLRSRGVQAVLIGTVGVQALAVAARDGGTAAETKSPASTVAATITRPAPVLARSDSSSAGDAETERLADAYRERGFNVPDALAAEIVEAARENGIAPEVAFGLVATESEFKPTALSPVGAIGLAQLMPATARLLRPGTTGTDLRDPEINLSLGFRFLRDLLVKYDGDTALALLAYNRGPGTVDRILQRGGDPDNGYADEVLGRD
jgi:soluble lytic murein transglycosylase-like protein